MDRRTLAIGGVALLATAAVVAAIETSGAADRAGFLGPGPLRADVNLVLEVVLVLGLTWGMRLARSGSIEAHRRNQTAWVLVNAALVAFIMAGAMASFRLPSLRALADLGNALTVLHALLGTFTLVAGVWLVLQMNDLMPVRLRVARWRSLMRATLAGYWAVALLGIATYRYWYA
ncbi:MAG: hypothetical protein U1F58_08300 [Burkholderiales bacterium]